MIGIEYTRLRSAQQLQTLLEDIKGYTFVVANIASHRNEHLIANATEEANIKSLIINGLLKAFEPAEIVVHTSTINKLQIVGSLQPVDIEADRKLVCHFFILINK